MTNNSRARPSDQAGRAAHGASICVESPPSGDHPSRGDLFGTADEYLPVITLWQPWASLIFTGDKKHETRAFRFPAKYAGKRVAIHAAKALPKQIPMGLHLLCEMNWGAGGAWRETLPRGMILGTVELVETIPTERCLPATVDRMCGDWAPGRFAWRLERPEALPEPMPATGKQGWWKIAASAMSAGTAATTQIGAGLQPASAVAKPDAPQVQP